MGAIYVEHSAAAMGEPELKIWFRNKVAEQRYERGHDAYAGVWNDSLKICPNVFATDKDATEWLQNNSDKWGAVLAVKVGNFTKAFPATKADQALVAQHAEIKARVDFFEFDVASRVRGQKSEKKGCGSCGSTINIKKMWLPTRRDYESALQGGRSLGAGDSFLRLRDKLQFVHYQGILDCPVCGANLLMTDTDKKQRAALCQKAAALTKKLDEAKKAHEEKLAKEPVKPHWLLGSWCAY